MGMFDNIFTGQSIVDASDQSRNNLLRTQQGVTDRTWNAKNEAQDYINTGYGGARTNLGQGFGAANTAINQGAGSALGYLDQGQQGALGQLGQARTDLTAGGGAYAPLSALAERYGQGGQLYGDSLGLGGAEGNQRAQQAFQTGPGYEFALNSGIDSLARRANAAGQLTGGNQNRDAITFAQGLANQEYGNWQNRLKGIGDQELAATQGAAAGNQANNTTLANLGVTGANLLNTGGQNRAQVAQGQGNSLADIAQRYYTGQAQNDIGQYGALAGNVNNAAGQINAADLNIAPQVGKTFMDAGNAEMAGSTNLWNMGMQAAKLAAGGLGGAGGSSFLPSASFLQNGFNPGGSQGVW